MRQAHTPNTPAAQPQSELARRLAAGASVQDMMRRGEIGGQALGLIQMMAAGAQADLGPRAHARGTERTPLGVN